MTLLIGVFLVMFVFIFPIALMSEVFRVSAKRGGELLEKEKEKEIDRRVTARVREAAAKSRDAKRSSTHVDDDDDEIDQAVLDTIEDFRLALKDLGFPKTAADKTVRQLTPMAVGGATIQELIKEALTGAKR